jgi:hypothetical protein
MVKGELRNKKSPWKPERHKKISQNAYIQIFQRFLPEINRLFQPISIFSWIWDLN